MEKILWKKLNLKVGRFRDCKDSNFEEKKKKSGEKIRECKIIIFKVLFFEVTEIQFTDIKQNKECWRSIIN